MYCSCSSWNFDVSAFVSETFITLICTERHGFQPTASESSVLTWSGKSAAVMWYSHSHGTSAIIRVK